MYWTFADQHTFNADELACYTIYSLLKKLRLSSVLFFCLTLTGCPQYLIDRLPEAQNYLQGKNKNKQKTTMSNPFFSRYAGCQLGHEYSVKFPCFASMLSLEHSTSLNFSICTFPLEITILLQIQAFLKFLVLIIIINPLTARVVGAPQMILQPVFSIFPCSALWDLPNSRPVHFLMLSSHLFLCLSYLLPPFTVPCKMVLARPDEQEAWPYHYSLRLFTIVRRSSCGLIACWILAWTSSLLTWSLYEMSSILR